MNNQLLTDGTVVYYAHKVNGIIQRKFESSFLAEQEKAKMPQDQQQIVEIVPVTADGKEVLFG